MGRFNKYLLTQHYSFSVINIIDKKVGSVSSILNNLPTPQLTHVSSRRSIMMIHSYSGQIIVHEILKAQIFINKRCQKYTMKKILAQGAEATISLLDNKIIKNRLKKSYRLPAIDEKLRKQRTKAEAKILKKLYIHLPVPKLISTDDKSQLTLEYLDGGKNADILSKKKCLAIAKQNAQNITKMHDLDIIHADLTTSNMIYKNKQVFFIDFGL